MGIVFCGKAYCVEADSLRVNELEEVLVEGVRGGAGAPFTATTITSETLQDFSATGQELPMLLSRTAGVLGWSDNGIGIGTSYLRIRGSGDERINVTLDGVPLNSGEDGCVFWANMNSYSSFLQSVQVVRGVGSSSNGDGCFGGSVSLQTRSSGVSPSLTATVSYGSYNTFTGGIDVSSGLLRDRYSVDLSYHDSRTDGYVHGTGGNSGSLYLSFNGYWRDIIVSYKNILNYEVCGQAWNGIDSGELYDGNYGVATGLRSYKDFVRAGLGRYNNLVEQLSYDPDRGYYTTPYTLSDGRRWDKTTDNFYQDKSILSAVWDVSSALRMALSLHYTYGYGYYQEFKPDCKLSKFGLSNYLLSDGEQLSRADFVRKKGLSQHTFGGVYNLNYHVGDLELSCGVSAQEYYCWHFGKLTYTSNGELSQVLGTPDYSYYDSDARKFDGNIYARARYDVWRGLSLYGDVQYRHVDYTTWGVNDKFVAVGDGYENQALDISAHYNFVNPKAGLIYSYGAHRATASVAWSHREPTRNNFTDNGSYPAPVPERVTDIEVAYSYKGRHVMAEVVGYYMRYHNAFVQTGELSDIGEALTTNIRRSYRMGLELTCGVTPCQWLTVSGNVALSRNRIDDFDEVVENWDTGTEVIHYDSSTLSFSPSVIGNVVAAATWKGLSIAWHTAFVSGQYLDNTSCATRRLPGYSVSDVSVGYEFALVKRTATRRHVPTLGVTGYVTNVFNRCYAVSGWVYSALYPTGGHNNDNRYCEVGYYPGGVRTVLVNVTFRY